MTDDEAIARFMGWERCKKPGHRGWFSPDEIGRVADEYGCCRQSHGTFDTLDALAEVAERGLVSGVFIEWGMRIYADHAYAHISTAGGSFNEFDPDPKLALRAAILSAIEKVEPLVGGNNGAD